MGILETQQHELEVQNLFSQDPEIRAGARRRLAALPGGVLQKSARKAEAAAEAERATYLWAKANPTFALEANFQVMKNFLAEAGIQISADTDAYDLAFRACRNQLAERAPEVSEPTAEEVRIARNEKLKSMSKEELREQLRQDVRRRFEVPTWTPEFSASEFKRMSPSQVFAILRYPNGQKREGAEEAINKLLQDAVLSSSNSATK
jgi:hypothetical protein